MMTLAEFLAIPDDGILRELIRGEVRVRGPAIHSRFHGAAMVEIGVALCAWAEDRDEPLGVVYCGGVGYQVRREQDSLLGIDVAYVSNERLAASDENEPFLDVPPDLAVEILEETDSHTEMVEKIGLDLEAGIVVWEVDPARRLVHVHRPGHLSETFDESQILLTEPELPGFRMPVAPIFE